MIDSCYHFLLVEGGAASSVAGGQHSVLRRLGVTGRLVSGYSIPPPPLQPLPYPGSHGARSWRVTERDCSFVLRSRSPCAVRPVNSCRICSDARNIGLFITATISSLPTCRHVITSEYNVFHVNKNRCTRLL